MADPKRRSAFEHFLEGSGQPQQPTGSDAPGHQQPASVLDQMKVELRKRNRVWEEKNPSHSYRGVPQDIQEQVVALAYNLRVIADEVAQVFIQYGLACVEKGTLKISPRPKSQRMTLFPLPSGWSEQAGWQEADGWSPSKPKDIPAKKNRTSSQGEKAWKRFVHYRMNGDIHEAVRRVAESHALPIGEVMTLFLKHGLESYKSGRLVLNPHPKVVKMTLTEGSS